MAFHPPQSAIRCYYCQKPVRKGPVHERCKKASQKRDQEFLERSKNSKPFFMALNAKGTVRGAIETTSGDPATMNIGCDCGSELCYLNAVLDISSGKLSIKGSSIDGKKHDVVFCLTKEAFKALLAIAPKPTGKEVR